MGKTPKMIEFFNEKIGTAYAVSQVRPRSALPEFGGGMENISATTMTDSILRDPIASLERDSDSIVAHELAHQWFGDLLTCRDWSTSGSTRGSPATSTPSSTSSTRGEDAFRLTMAGEPASYLGSDRQYRRPIVEARYADPDEMFDGVTYAKGACVLHALRGLIGDDAWWRGIKLYVAANKDAGGRHRRLPQGDGDGLGQGPRLVLRPVGLPRRPPRADRPVAVRGRRQDRPPEGRAGPGRRRH